jgi:hypothetical protein
LTEIREAMKAATTTITTMPTTTQGHRRRRGRDHQPGARGGVKVPEMPE